MEKIRTQILMDAEHYDFLSRYCVENECKNFSHAMCNLMDAYRRFQLIVKDLQKRAHESEIWKERAQERVKDALDQQIDNYKNATVIKE